MLTEHSEAKLMVQRVQTNTCSSAWRSQANTVRPSTHWAPCKCSRKSSHLAYSKRLPCFDSSWMRCTGPGMTFSCIYLSKSDFIHQHSVGMSLVHRALSLPLGQVDRCPLISLRSRLAPWCLAHPAGHCGYWSLFHIFLLNTWALWDPELSHYSFVQGSSA